MLLLWRNSQTALAPQAFKSPTGEDNTLSLHPRGLMLCISPWNFPLAIFLGQITANLAAGNTVIAKPASQTMRIGQAVISLFHEAGFPQDVVQLLACNGQQVSDHVLPDPRVKGVVFTGSTQTAQQINRRLAERTGPIVPLIAETGGINAMIVDASALPEQVIQDVLVSAFNSAGQRCSALRILILQEEIADKMMAMLKGAIAELVLGDPASLSTDIGPLIDEAAKEKLMTQIADLQTMGLRITDETLTSTLPKGNFVAPAVFEVQNLAFNQRDLWTCIRSCAIGKMNCRKWCRILINWVMVSP